MASGGGCMDIIKYALDNGAKDYGGALISAAEAGNTEVMTLMIDKYKADNYNYAMIKDSANGYLEIVIWMYKLEANHLDESMVSAAKAGYKDIVEYLINNGGKEYNRTMAAAAQQGYKDIVQLMMNKGADIFYQTIASASINGYTYILKMIMDVPNNMANKNVLEYMAQQSAEYGKENL